MLISKLKLTFFRKIPKSDNYSDFSSKKLQISSVKLTWGNEKCKIDKFWSKMVCFRSFLRDFRPKICHFWEKNNKNDDQGEFLDFFEFTLFIIFPIFRKIIVPIAAIFVKNLKSHIWNESVRIQEYTLDVIFVIFTQKWQFRLKN